MLHNGAGLGTVSSIDLPDVAYRLMVAYFSQEKNVIEAIEGLNKQLANRAFEEETGMPALTQRIPSADEMYKGR